MNQFRYTNENNMTGNELMERWGEESNVVPPFPLALCECVPPRQPTRGKSNRNLRSDSKDEGCSTNGKGRWEAWGNVNGDSSKIRQSSTSRPNVSPRQPGRRLSLSRTRELNRRRFYKNYCKIDHYCVTIDIGCSFGLHYANENESRRVFIESL